jgi:hypothetical protein
VSDPPGDDAGLPGAGAGEDEERPLSMEHGLTLGRVQILEELVW